METLKKYMLKLLVPGMVLAAGVPVLGQGLTYHLGSPATAEEIRPLDIAIGPAGKELPPGHGTAQEGAKVYAAKCAVCHGATGTETLFHTRPLVGGKDERDVSNYWHATSIWNVINHSMPLNAQRVRTETLSADEVYALTAFLLYRNGIIQESDVIDAKTLPKVQMPSRK